MGRWDSSDRRSRLPANWPKLRLQAFERDGHRCTWVDVVDGRRVRCNEPATDADHHIPGDDHSLENIRSLCHPHHALKTGREGAAAKAKNRAGVRKRFRRTEIHPALAAGVPAGHQPKWKQWAA